MRRVEPIVGIFVYAVCLCTACLCAACKGETETKTETETAPEPVLPQALPFEVSREGALEPLPAEEVQAFTRKMTGFLGSTDYFQWIIRTSHGVHASTGKPDFALWWQDVDAEKAGDTVTFRHGDRGGGHNVYIPTSRVLAAVAGGYLLTGDETMGAVVEQYSKGLAAACRGMVFDDHDPNTHLMARNFVAQNHDYVIDGGRKKSVDFTGWYNPYEQWNAERVRFPSNPYWGDIWVTNTRSKDDVPHIYLAALMLRYVIEYGADESVREAARLGTECVTGFAKDIVDSGYVIRTKDAAGQPFIPSKDLASFVTFESLVPNGECSGKLTSALLAYGDAQGNDCGKNGQTDYEGFAVGSHYFNYAIIRTFHISALLGALIERDHETARRLLEGLILRTERYSDPGSDEVGRKHPRWETDLAAYYLVAASVGLPLTASEVRIIHARYSAAIDAFLEFPSWDLWSASVADGPQPYRPDDEAFIRAENMAMPLLYCGSPFKSTLGAIPVDCALLADRASWGR